MDISINNSTDNNITNNRFSYYTFNNNLINFRRPQRTRTQNLDNIINIPANYSISRQIKLPNPSPIFENIKTNLNIPNYLCCPISLQIFKDPIITNDGYTYDRESLQDLLIRTNLSPMTREVIIYATRNRAIRDCVLEFIQQL